MEGQNAHMYIQEHLADNSFRRRALAFDLIRLVCYEVMNSYHADLMGHMQEDHHLEIPGNSNVSVTQVLRADRAVFLHLAENLTSLKRTLDGELPLEKELPIALMRPTVSFHLLPTGCSSIFQAIAQGESEQCQQTQSRRPTEATFAQAIQDQGQRERKIQAKRERSKRAKRFGRQRIGDGRWQTNMLALQSYNMAPGCADAPPGAQCQCGAHVCAEVGCGKPHSLLAHKGS